MSSSLSFTNARWLAAGIATAAVIVIAGCGGGSTEPTKVSMSISEKGKTATLRDVQVMDAARAAGLVDNKVASFSATHTSIRLVIPVALRPR